MTRKRVVLAVVAATLVACVAGAASAATANAGAAVPPAAATCAACHGADGMGNAATGYPRLAGLNAAYLLRQLEDFASGARRNPVMQPIAHGLGAQQRKALAAYFSGLPVVSDGASPAAAASTAGADRGLGATLALRGRWSRQIPGCVKCHGPRGVGVGANFPPLAGQPAAYLASQLRAFKDGSRRDDPLGLMRHVASGLSAKDIAAVAAWFAAQPVQDGGRSR
ncbi:MAG TPA: c-type cytochrome [Rhodanobacteraceae bacterium]